MILKMTIELTVDDEIYGDSEEEKIWLENEILVGDGNLLLHSNEIGETIGSIKKVSNIVWQPDLPQTNEAGDNLADDYGLKKSECDGCKHIGLCDLCIDFHFNK